MKLRLLLIYSSLLVAFYSSAQMNLVSMHTFYKDRLYSTQQKFPAYSGNSFFPVAEDQYDLHKKIADTTKQFYTFTELLFKKHLLEFKGENFHITMSPVFNLSMSQDLEDTLERKLNQNTRGFFVEGDLFKNFSFSTSFYENQSRNPLYQTNYFNLIGEQYVNSANTNYYTENAVIPGGGRTKVFKKDGFDYAFAVGNIVYKPIKHVTISAGNNQHFIGDGYRSMLLSDNSYSAPYFQVNYRLLPKIEFVYLRAKLLNLLRKPENTGVEAYYEPKAYAVNYLSFQLTEKMSLSLFEGTIYSRGDSILSKKAHPLFYNPIPLLGAFALNDSTVNSILGLNFGFNATKTVRIYSQFAFNNKSQGVGGQLGFRLSEPFKVSNFYIQLELNYASSDLYSARLSRLRYSHYNLPLAHPKGQGFVEGVLRVNYEFKRAYVDLKTIYYTLDDYSELSLMPARKTKPSYSGSIFHNELEIGYRFNRKLNFSLFVNWLLRSDTFSAEKLTNVFGIGIRTGLLNHYYDF